jgi:uncharacterized protein (DUF58 family)
MIGGAFILFAVGTSVQAGWVLAIAALLGGLVISGTVLGFRALVGVEIARNVPRTASAGQPLPVTIDVSNRGRTPRGLVLVSDDFCGRGSALARLVRPGQHKRFRGLRNDCRRGVYEGGAAVVETGFPFGVVRTRKRVTLPSSLIVYPKTYEVTSRVAAGGGGWRAPSAFGDISSVRDYHVGDPLRHIHWRTVARRGQLVVREFDHERRAETTFVVSVPDDPDVADAIASISTSLAIGSLRDAGEVGLLTGGRVVTDRSVDGVLEWGARIDAGGSSLGAAPDITTSSIVCVCTPDAPGLDAFAARFAERFALVVLVGDRAGRTTIAGAPTARVKPEEVEAWFAHGCAVS